MFPPCTWDLVSKSFWFRMWSTLGLVTAGPGFLDLVWPAQIKRTNLFRIECQHHHDDPHQRLISALSAYFPWLFVEEKFKTEILNRNRIPFPHLKKTVEEKRSNHFYFIFSYYGDNERGRLCFQKVNWLAGWFVSFPGYKLIGAQIGQVTYPRSHSLQSWNPAACHAIHDSCLLSTSCIITLKTTHTHTYTCMLTHT